MAQNQNDTVFENDLYQTTFYFDWNSGSVNDVKNKSNRGFIWPGLIFTQNEANLHNALDPYIRGDVEDDANDAESTSDFDFNDLIDGHREKYLTADIGIPRCNFKNKNKIYLVRVGEDKNALLEIHLPANDEYNPTLKQNINPISLEYITGIGDYYIYDGDAKITAKTADGINMTDNPKLKNLRYDDAVEGLYAEESGIKYWLYNSQNERLNNIAVWGDNFYLYAFKGSSDGKIPTVVPVAYRKRRIENTDKYFLVKQNWNDVVAIDTHVPEVEMLNVYVPNTSNNVINVDSKKVSQISYWRSYRSVHNIYVEARNLIRKHSPKPPKDVHTARKNALNNMDKVWRTPTEFYTQQRTDTNSIPKGENGYIRSKVKKEDEDQKKTVPVWWWSNTFKNWCTFKKIKKHTILLYVWNGCDDWDSWNTIFKSSLMNDVVVQKYLYDLRYFVRGHQYYGYIAYDSMNFDYKQVRLTGESKFSHYDSETFQTVKIAKAHVDGKGTQRYPTTAGIPPIARMPSGELMCYYYLRVPGMSKQNEVIWDENIDFVNAVCQAYFGTGDDKTIKEDWKNFEKINDDSEEVATDIFSKDESSLVDADEINTTKENKNVSLLNLNVPRQYPEGKNITPDSYVERWDF